MRQALTMLVLITVLAAAVAATAAPGIEREATAKVRVPNVVGMRMDRATRLLRSRNLRVNEECTGLFGCILKRNRWICAQAPRAGKLVREFSVVTIFGARRGSVEASDGGCCVRCSCASRAGR